VALPLEPALRRVIAGRTDRGIGVVSLFLPRGRSGTLGRTIVSDSLAEEGSRSWAGVMPVTPPALGPSAAAARADIVQ
jgi:hypothetical protein